MAIQSPWLVEYLAQCSELLGDDLSRSTASNAFQGRNLTVLQASHSSASSLNMTWVVLSDGMFSIVAKISKGAVERPGSLFVKKPQEQPLLGKGQLVKLQRFRPVLSRVPTITGDKLSGMSEEPRIALQVDELHAKEIADKASPSPVPLVNGVPVVSAWEHSLRRDTVPGDETASLLAMKKKHPIRLSDLRRHPNISHEDCLRVLSVLVASVAPEQLASSRTDSKAQKRDNDPLALKSSPLRGPSPSVSSPVSPNQWPKSPTPAKRTSLSASSSPGSQHLDDSDPATPEKVARSPSPLSESESESSTLPPLNRQVPPPPSIPKKRRSSLLEEIVLVPASDASMSVRDSQSQSQPLSTHHPERDALLPPSSPPSPSQPSPQKVTVERLVQISPSKSPRPAIYHTSSSRVKAERPGQHDPGTWLAPSFEKHAYEKQAAKTAPATSAPVQAQTAESSKAGRSKERPAEACSSRAITKKRAASPARRSTATTGYPPPVTKPEIARASPTKRKRRADDHLDAPALKKRHDSGSGRSDEEISRILGLASKPNSKGKARAVDEVPPAPLLNCESQRVIDVPGAQKLSRTTTEQTISPHRRKVEPKDSRESAQKGKDPPPALLMNPNPSYPIMWADLGDILLRRALEKYKPSSTTGTKR